MRKPLTAALLLGGHLTLTLHPVAALAATVRPADYGDSHYRCMYHCDERYGSGNGRDRYDHSHSGYDRGGRAYRNGECAYHDDWGWHHCGYRDRYWSYEGR